MRGFVSIVGAGPGSPDLLTRKGARLLEAADLVLYDALVSPDVLALAGRARRFFVGKRAGHPGLGQEEIHGLMIRAARRGKRVVRLKGGDPFVFGRGGEEALALARAGVPFEVVPGVSSALAAPALASIPVTHRGLASAFLVVSGHGAASWGPVLGSVRPNSLTLVVLMGLSERREIATRLLEWGWKGETPVAVCRAAATVDAATWRGSLFRLASASDQAAGESAGVLVIGAVVSVAAELDDLLERMPAGRGEGEGPWAVQV
jgi:uroporphyrin-III C-methyltransferase/precorrin-2 dehydrogenase/sirohydrochlorin ferrochelatase